MLLTSVNFHVLERGVRCSSVVLAVFLETHKSICLQTLSEDPPPGVLVTTTTTTITKSKQPHLMKFPLILCAFLPSLCLFEMLSIILYRIYSLHSSYDITNSFYDIDRRRPPVVCCSSDCSMNVCVQSAEIFICMCVSLQTKSCVSRVSSSLSSSSTSSVSSAMACVVSEAAAAAAAAVESNSIP